MGWLDNLSLTTNFLDIPQLKGKYSLLFRNMQIMFASCYEYYHLSIKCVHIVVNYVVIYIHALVHAFLNLCFSIEA